MQIIQTIRDKGAAIVIVIIALSLIGFILMDAKQGSNRLFSSMSSNVGKVNGETIELSDFSKRVKESEDAQSRNSQRQPPQTNQVREQMWNQMVAEKVFFAETKKLGIDLTAKELSYILLSNDQNNPLLKEPGMLDSATGKLDIVKASSALANIKKFKGEQRDAVSSQVIDPLKITLSVAKYTGLLNASVYYPAWMQQKENAEAKSFASISYVNIPYSEIPDSTVKVSDAEINDYVDHHKDMFKQEEGRNVSYVAFSQLPGKEDSAATEKIVGDLKNEFAADTNTKAFIARNVSATEFSDEFIPRPKITSPSADTITKLPVGQVYGPYADNGNYVLAKLVGTKELPDSVDARHILIAVDDAQTGKPVREDSVAKKLADSIYQAINAGADFAALALQYSSDGTKTKGGDLGNFGYGAMVPEFNAFSFSKPVGSRGVVKTQFGYHIIEVMSQKNFKPAYKIAYMAREITASDNTLNKAKLDAIRASAEKTSDKLAKYAAAHGLKMTTVPTMVKENDFSVGELQDRGLVRWIFEAKKGDVSEFYSIKDQFIVATVDKINKKGVQDAVTARAGTESIIRNKKKADLIVNKLGKTPTLESAATAYKKQVQQAGLDSSVTMASQIINGLGVESKVIGASFNKEFETKVSPPIKGTSGVYLLKVNGIQTKAADTPEMMLTQANARKTALRGQVNSWYEGLRKLADITDNRSKHF